MELYDIINRLSKLENDWINVWCYQDNRNKALEIKSDALKNATKLKSQGYNVKDIYKQLDAFEKCAKGQKELLTSDEDEKYMLAAVYYAEQNMPIVYGAYRKSLDELAVFEPAIKRKKKAARYKYDTRKDLIFLYLSYKDTIDVYAHVIDFMDFTQSLIDEFGDEDFRQSDIAIPYLKFLIKKKEFDKARGILDKYTISPIGKGETDALEKIKQKL